MFEQLLALCHHEEIQAKYYAVEIAHQLFVELKLSYDRSNAQISAMRDELVGEIQLLIFLTMENGVRQMISEITTAVA